MTQSIYIGPNIFKLGLLRNQVYLDGLPGQVRAALTEYPEINDLIVPIDNLTDSLNKAATKGEHLHHVYHELLRKAGKE